ncbi:hypothetical protein ES708_16910 [subsurface metagenome]
MSYDVKARISELENKIAAVCRSCSHAKWLIGGFQCTVGRSHCRSRRVSRWLDEIKRPEEEKQEG